MSKAKKVVKVTKPKAVKQPRVTKPKVGAVAPKAPEAAAETKKVLPMYDGKQIIRVCSKPAPKGFVLCEAMDGQTKVTIHVPVDVLK